MATNQPVYITTGTVNGAPIMVDIGTNGVAGGNPVGVRVTMSAGKTYVMSAPEGYPAPPFLTGSTQADAFRPGLTYGPGTVLVLLAPEAAALVAAGAAS